MLMFVIAIQCHFNPDAFDSCDAVMMMIMMLIMVLMMMFLMVMMLII